MSDAVPGRVEDKFCEPCSRKDIKSVADIYCEECGEYQCSICAGAHKLYRVMSNHNIVNANEAGRVVPNFDMKGLDKCQQHKEILKFFCEDDKQLCCSTCAIVSHRKCHSVVEINQKVKTEAPDLDIFQTDLVEIEAKARAIVHHLTETRERFTNNASDVYDTLQQHQHKINVMFENLKKRVSNEITTFQLQAFKELDTKHDMCNSVVADVKQTLSDVSNISRLGSPSKQFIMANYVRETVNGLKTKVETEQDTLQDISVQFVFDEPFKLFLQKEKIPAELTIKYVRCNDRCNDLSNLTEGIQPTVDQKFELNLLHKVSLKKSDTDQHVSYYTGMDFLPDGRLVVVDNNNSKCILFNQKLEQIDSYALSFTPQDIVSVSENEVAVTSGGGKKIIFLCVGERSKLSLSREINVKTKYASMCLMDETQFIASTVGDSQPVKVVSMSGNEKILGVHFPSKTYENEQSACTYIRKFNKLVITDRRAHTVFIYDLVTNTHIEVKDNAIKEPRGAAVGPADYVFVCSKNTNSIVQISHTGKILTSQTLNMEFPLSVCVSKDNKRLAVSNSGIFGHNRKLQIYNIVVV